MGKFISLHGGHSWPSCTHAEGSLEELVEAAIERGIDCFGVTEHAPKSREQDLDEDDLAAGVTPEANHAAIDVLAQEIFPRARDRFAGRIRLVWGMETDVTPEDTFVPRMRALVQRYGVRYLVGSVHHVADVPIDAGRAEYDRAVRAHGDVESLQLAYFALQAQLIEALEPAVVGHFDLIRKHEPLVGSAAVRAATSRNLERIADLGLLLELNASPPRDHEGDEPFPNVAVLERARALDVRITLGDDSHSPSQVAGGLAACVVAAQRCGFHSLWELAEGPSGTLVPQEWRSL